MVVEVVVIVVVQVGVSIWVATAKVEAIVARPVIM